jgi:very-short-patch-repair endonuclease
MKKKYGEDYYKIKEKKRDQDRKKYPYIKYWSNQNDKSIDPSKLNLGSEREYIWQCQKEKRHQWTARLNNFIRSLKINKKFKCPLCLNQKIDEYNNLEYLLPDLAKEWDYKLNFPLKPDQVAPGSSKKVYWICSRGHSYQAPIATRAGPRKSGCGKCNLVISRPQIRIYTEMKTIFDEVFTNHRFDEQKHFKEIDIFIKDINLAIEYDGATFHKNKELDLEKNNLVQNAGLHLIRIREHNIGKLNEEDILVKKGRNLTKKFMNELLHSVLIKLSLNEEQIKKINQYIGQDKFLADKEFSQIILDRPDPPLEKSLEYNFPHLAKDWDFKLNKPFTPRNFYQSSSLEANWLCHKCKYKWKTKIYMRTRSYKTTRMLKNGKRVSTTVNPSGCPACK